MAEKIKIEDLDGLKKVHDVMVGLSLPNLNADALKAVGKIEGNEFKKAIVNIANNEDAMNHAKVYINGITCLLTGPVQSVLASMGYINLPNETLIKLGKECGKEFRTYLSGASRNDADSVAWIQKKITEHGSSAPVKFNEQKVAAPTQPSARQANEQKQNNVANINQNRYQEEPDLSRQHSPYPNATKSNNQPSNETGTAEREFFSMTFYGSKSALCFNAVEKEGSYSITLDGGNKKPNQPEGGKAIDWQDKVVFGFSFEELVEFAWVLLGINDTCEFSGHGPLHDKSFQFKRQDKGYFASCSAKDKGSRAIPLSYAAGLRIMMLVMRQLNKNFPDMTINEIIMMLHKMAKPQQRVAHG